MISFDVAWDSIEKEWSPGWSYRARALPALGNDDLRRISQQWLEDTGQLHEDYVGYEDYPSGQTMEFVLPHPDDEKFVVKKPRLGSIDYPMDWLKPDTLFPSRFGGEYHGKNLIQELEDLGFPVVSEYNVDDRYLLQPWLNSHEPDFGMSRNERPRKGIADVALEHIIPDRSDGNWGIDQTGNWRMFDVDMGLPEPTDYLPISGLSLDSASYYEPERLGERLQQGLDKFGIQLPASRLLNFMSHIDHGREKMQQFLEAIEPHSDNPNKVEVDGKRPWLEGY